MKRILLTLLAGVWLLPAPGCKGGGSEAQQSDIDSLVKLVPATERHKIPPSIKFSEALKMPGAPASPASTPIPSSPPGVENYMMNVPTANQYIQGMHKLFKNKGGAVLPGIDSLYSAWLIPANTLQKIVDTGNWIGNNGVNSPSPYVLFYLGYDNVSQQLKLLYTGIRILPGQGANGTDSFTEVWYGKADDPSSSMLFDNNIPCPFCAGLGIHTAVGQMSSIIENFSIMNDSTVKPATACPTCSISPAASDAGTVVQVQYGHNSQRFTYTFDAKHQFSYLVDNDTRVTDSATGYTFNNVKETHTFRVYYKNKP